MILDKTGNRKYSKNLKCSRCDVTVQSKERLKRHEQISKGVQNIQTCNECSFTSCTSSGLKSKSHKCLKSADGGRETKNCNKCGKQFSRIKDFEKHIATKDELTNCGLCDFKSCTKVGMAIHMKFHTLTMKKENPPEDMVLDIVDNVSSIDEKCPKNTNNTSKRPHQCNKCYRSFHNKANLELHMKTKDELKMCESCDFKSCTKLGFSYHMKKVHGIKLPKLRNKICCNFCDYKTDSKAWLDIHMKSKDEPTICEYCDFKSCTKLGFSNHMKKVHGIKLLNKICCNFCDYKTEKKAYLDTHMKSKDEPTICNLCDFKSCTKLGFSNHMKKVHGTKPRKRKHDIKLKMKLKKNTAMIFNCMQCDQKFYSKANLEFHEKKIRDEVLPCSKCDFKSCTKTGLKIHLRNVHEISSDDVENVPDVAMIIDALEQKQSIPMATHGRFMVAWNVRKNVSKN